MSQQTPLHAAHERAGASFTDFAGFDMPLRYDSDLVEHKAVRTTAGMFDLSHMAEIMVTGSQAAAFLDYALSNRLSALEDHQAKYSLLLTESGGVVDDLIVYRLGETEFLIVANAANRQPAREALKARAAGFEVAVTDSRPKLFLNTPASRSRQAWMSFGTTGLPLGNFIPTPCGLPERDTPGKTDMRFLYQATALKHSGMNSKQLVLGTA